MESLSYAVLPVKKYVKKLKKKRVGESVIPAESIDKALNLSASGEIGSMESLQGEMNFSGTIHFALLYLNKEDEIVSLSYKADFSDVIKDEAVTTTSRAFVSSDVLDCSIEKLNDSEFKVQCVFELTLLLTEREELNSLNEAPGVYVKKEDKSVQLFETTLSDVFQVEEEKNVPGIVSGILSSDGDAIVTQVDFENGRFVLEGFLCVNVNFRREEEYDAVSLQIPFREETEYAGEGEFKAYPTLALSELNVIAAVDEEKNETTLTVAAELRATLDVLKVEDYQLTVDAFVKGFVSNAQISGLNALELCDRRAARAGVDGRIECGTEIDRILAIAEPRVHIAGINAAGGELIVEGVLTACVLYADEENKKGSFVVEVPFQTDPERLEGEIAVAFSRGIVCDIHARLRLRGELEISFKTQILTDLFKEEGVCAVSDLEIVSEYQNTSLISVYVPGKGDSVFEVSKELNADPDSIDLEQFLEGEKVVVFRGGV